MAAVSVGVFGGAFDPPHVGHVALARAGIEQFGLDRLLVRVVARARATRTSRRPPRSASRSPSSPSRRSDEAEVALDPFARTVDSLEALELDDPRVPRRRGRVRGLPRRGRSPTASSSSRASASRRGRVSTATALDAVLGAARATRPRRRSSRSSRSPSRRRRSARASPRASRSTGSCPGRGRARDRAGSASTRRG